MKMLFRDFCQLITLMALLLFYNFSLFCVLGLVFFILPNFFFIVLS